MLISLMMKKFKKDEAPAQLPICRGRSTLLRSQLLQLQVGEVLFLAKEEWKSKSGPTYIVGHIKKTHSYLFEYGLKTDGSGWLFRRVK